MSVGSSSRRGACRATALRVGPFGARRARPIIAGLTAGLAIWLAACAGDTTDPIRAARRTDAVFWSMGVDQGAVLLSTTAPYNTLQLTVTLRDPSGAPLPRVAQDSAVTAYQVADPTDTTVTVTPTGLLRAWHETPGTLIRVRTTAQGITRADSVVVVAIDEPHPRRLARLTLAITPSDTLYSGDWFRVPILTAQVLDADGAVIDSAVARFRWSDPNVVFLAGSDRLTRYVSLGNSGRAGRAMLYGTATAYGVTRTDSIPLVVTWPYVGGINVRFMTPRASTMPVGYFEPVVDTVARGATVQWSLTAYDAPPIDVAFDTPAAAGPATDNFFAQYCGVAGESGDIPTFRPDTTEQQCQNMYRFRTFSRPGTYHYHSKLYGTKGTIVVMP